MKRINEKGNDFVAKEKERLKSLIDSKGTSEGKKNEFTMRINILNAFASQNTI
jgi:hypothetical protein